MKTDFEKLVVARKYIAALEQENSLLKKEIEEQFNNLKELEKRLQAERERKEKMTPDEKLKIKSDLYVKQMKEAINNLKFKLKTATEENKRLVTQLIKLKSEQG